MGPKRQATLLFIRDFLQELLDAEHDLEMVRKDLAYQKDFTLGAAFEIFSRSL
jgi:hypothetical protein